MTEMPVRNEAPGKDGSRRALPFGEYPCEVCEELKVLDAYGSDVLSSMESHFCFCGERRSTVYSCKSCRQLQKVYKEWNEHMQKEGEPCAQCGRSVLCGLGTSVAQGRRGVGLRRCRCCVKGVENYQYMPSVATWRLYPSPPCN